MMSKPKTGRNDLCPCGSGRKFKKCCLQGNAAISREEQLIDGGRHARVAAMSEVAELTIHRCRQRPVWRTANFDAVKVQIIIDEILNSASEAIASPRHSRQYWFVLIRRWADQLWDELQESTGKQLTEWVNPVVRLAGKLVLQVTDDSEPFEWVESNGQAGISYEGLGQPELLAIAKVFSLAAALYDAESRYRFACKGFQVFSNDENNALALQDTESVQFYEQRRGQFGTTSGSAGLWYDAATVFALEKDLCNWFGVSQVCNDRLYLKSVEPPAEIELGYVLQPDYDSYPGHPHQSTAIPYDRLLLDSALRPAFEVALSQNAQELVSFFYTVSQFIYHSLRYPRFNEYERGIRIDWDDETISFRQQILGHWNDVATLGMLRSSKEAWIQALLEVSESSQREYPSVPKLAETQIDHLIDQFTWTQGDAVYDNSPKLFVRLSSKTLALDATWLSDCLRHTLLQASVVGRDETKNIGDVTGPWFEKQAMSFFARELSLSENDYVFQRNVKDSVGAEEIDIAFVVDRCLFVLDCKAMSKTSEYMIGHYSLLRNRQTEQLKQLRKRNTARIRKIESGLTQERIAPEDFDRSVGLVCTTDVEYLPLDESDFWIGMSPLVGPPNELLETIKSVAGQAAGVGLS